MKRKNNNPRSLQESRERGVLCGFIFYFYFTVVL